MALDVPAAGSELTVSASFSDGQLVDVTGQSRGKGFRVLSNAGTLVRKMQPTVISLPVRAPGSIGQKPVPGRACLPSGIKYHMGDEQVTVQNLCVVRGMRERNLLLGAAVPCPVRRVDLIVRPAVKASRGGVNYLEYSNTDAVGAGKVQVSKPDEKAHNVT